MHCAHCGTPVIPGQRFCSKCGRPIVGTAPPAPAIATAPPPPALQTSVPTSSLGFARPSRVARHLTALGLLWIIYSGLRVIPGLALIGIGHMHFPFMMAPIPTPMRLFLAPFLGGIGVLISGFAIAGLIAGIGLMAHSPWARMLAIVVGCITLIHFPLGTALGIYTLWVLVPQGADTDYRSLASAR